MVTKPIFDVKLGLAGKAGWQCHRVLRTDIFIVEKNQGDKPGG